MSYDHTNHNGPDTDTDTDIAAPTDTNDLSTPTQPNDNDRYRPPRRTPIQPADDYHGAGYDPNTTLDGIILRFFNDICCTRPGCTRMADRLTHPPGRQPEPVCDDCSDDVVTDLNHREYPLTTVLDDLFDGTVAFSHWSTDDGHEYELANSGDPDDDQWIRAVNSHQTTSVYALSAWE